MKNLKFICSLLVLCSLSMANAQAPAIEWVKSYGGSQLDVAFDLINTIDGGYVISGYSQSNDGDVDVSYGGGDIWLLKTDVSGAIQWQKTFGGSGYDIAEKILQTTDGGYILAGTTASVDGDIANNFGEFDVWVVKINASGDMQWEKNYGGQSYESARNIIATSDGGYLFIADTDSADNDVSVSLGGSDIWVVKINSSGVIQWEKSYGGSNNELAYGLIENTSGNYVIAGYTISNDGDVTQNNGDRDVWVFEISTTGDMIWQNSFGGSSDEEILSIQDTSDGGYLLAGYTASSDGDVSNTTGIQAAWIIKINTIGNMVWEKTYGGSGVEVFKTLNKHPNGGFIASGKSTSSDGDVSINNGEDDIWILRIDEIGEIIWEKSIGGSNNEESFGFIINSDGSYVLSGYSNSTDGDVTSNNGSYDAWIVKLAADALSVSSFEEIFFSVHPNPAETQINISANTAMGKISVSDVFGREVTSSLPNTTFQTLSLENLAAGAYFVKVEANGNVKTLKILKK